MWPSSSITKPEPVAVPPPSGSPNGLKGEASWAGSVGFDEGDAAAVALVDLVDDVRVAALVVAGDRRREGAPASAGADSSPESIQPAEIAIQPKNRPTTTPAEEGGAE